MVTDDRPLVESFAAVMSTAGEPPGPAAGDSEPGRATFIARLLAATWTPLPVRNGPPPDTSGPMARLRNELTPPAPGRQARFYLSDQPLRR